MRRAVAVGGMVVLAAGAARAGELTGTVRADPVPASKAEAVTKDQSVCGKEAMHERLVVGPGGALANAVVAVKGLKGPVAPTPGAAVDQVGCRYTPHVQAVTVGTTLAVLNNDAVLHNVHATVAGPTPITVFNLAMPFKGGKLPRLLPRPAVLALRCDAGHTWMSAYIHVFDHPFFAVTDAKGRFVIKGVPAGKHEVEVWHEGIEAGAPPVVKTTTVEVAEGKPAVADVVLGWPR